MAKYTPLANVTTKTEFAAEFQKIANAIDDQLDRKDPTSNQLSVDLDVNGYRLLNLPVPTEPTDALRVVDIPGIFFNFFNASDFSYDNTDSGLSATNVQDAIDEVDNDVDVLDSRIDTVEFTLGNFGPRLVTAENDINQLQSDVTATNLALANEVVRIDNLQDDKADKDTDAVVDNLAIFDATGNPVDGGLSIDDILNTAPTFVQEDMPTGSIDEGATWYNPTLATTFIYYVYTDSAQWVETGFSVDAEAGVAQVDFLNLTDRVTELEDTLDPAKNRVFDKFGGTANNELIGIGYAATTRVVWVTLPANNEQVYTSIDVVGTFKLLNRAGSEVYDNIPASDITAVTPLKGARAFVIRVIIPSTILTLNEHYFLVAEDTSSYITVNI